MTINDVIGDFYNSPDARILFNCKKNETVYKCLSCCIDHFNIIMNNKTCISTIVNNASKKDCELSSQ